MQHTITRDKVRFVILHYHLFKNAGTTLSALLERNFPGQLAYLHHESAGEVLRGSEVLDFLRSQPSIRVISSHHLRLPSPESEGFVFFDFLTVRDPLDRLRSMYDFYRRSGDLNDPFVATAKDRSLSEFMALLLDRFPHLVNNVQVNFFANAGRYTRPLHEGDLERAINIIRNSAVPVVAEFFEMGMVVAEYFLRPAFGPLDLSYTPANVTPKRHENLNERLSGLRQACGEELYGRLVKSNGLDLRLVAAATDETRRRFHQLPHGELDLSDFHDRCKRRASEQTSQIAVVSQTQN